jgi:H+-transporting ATPase
MASILPHARSDAHGKSLQLSPPQNISLMDGDFTFSFFFWFVMQFITLLNDGTLISIAYDYAEASPMPNRWNLPVLFGVSSVLGCVSCIGSLLLLHLMLDSWNPDGLFQKLGLEGLQYGQITTAIYLKISVSDFLTLFSARTGRRFFWEIKPAPILLAGATIALAISSLVSIFWPDSEPDGILTEGLQGNLSLFWFVWIYCVLFWLLQDLAKVLTYHWMYASNFNNISSTGIVELPESALQLIKELETALEEEKKKGTKRPSHH